MFSSKGFHGLTRSISVGSTEQHWQSCSCFPLTTLVWTPLELRCRPSGTIGAFQSKSVTRLLSRKRSSKCFKTQLERLRLEASESRPELVAPLSLLTFRCSSLCLVCCLSLSLCISVRGERLPRLRLMRVRPHQSPSSMFLSSSLFCRFFFQSQHLTRLQKKNKKTKRKEKQKVNAAFWRLGWAVL